jgi:phosphohistidine phosphatase SixA
MNVYLMRHCLADKGARMDSVRGLSADGAVQAEEMAAFLKRMIGRVDVVISSPFARAVQTADVMAKALGSYVVTTAMLEPDRKPAEAWADIERIAQASTDVLVIGHHPELGRIIDLIAGASGIGKAFTHGSIAAVNSDPRELLWLVKPWMVERQVELTAEEAAMLADIFEAADAGLTLVESLGRRSLRHPDHARLITPIARKVKTLMTRLFADQRTAVLEAARPWLKLHMKEADDNPATTPPENVKPDAAAQLATDILPDTMAALHLTVSAADASGYRDLIQTAIEKATAQLEAELRSGATIPETQLSRYLEQNSLGKLTGGLDETSKQRLRDAVANAVSEGGTADDIVGAIEDTFTEFEGRRAELIAQTEVNDAYNFGRHKLASAAGLDEKEWVTESAKPCLECIANEAVGWMPIEGEFPSGDEIPTAHPGCYCGVDFRRVS